MKTDNNRHINQQASLEANVEDQIARNIVELLDSRAQKLSDEHSLRLAEARSLAIGRLVSQEAQLAGSHRLHRNGHALQWFGGRFGHYFEQHRVFSTLLVVCVMLLTFFAVQQFSVNHQIENSDAFLLASDLPPEAYADKGFTAWLDTN
ncbi:DUF3619 family protein [Methylotenera sp. L2L1]|uniref:DUF3619 family protein n=1 Tax=Methylotenera sp. L2L1 TaxID=1502770 RepID=UPI00055ED904|nr:DUF3619 family protein [Methylotenera sp. L2L1]